MAGQRWRWSAQVTPIPILPTVRRIDVSVAPLGDAKLDPDQQNQFAMITGFYGEKIAQPGAVSAQFNVPSATLP